MSIEDLLAGARKAREEKRQAEDRARQDARAQADRERLAQWQRCWQAAATAIHPDLLECLSEEMPDDFTVNQTSARIPLRLPGMADAHFCLQLHPPTSRGASAPFHEWQWRPQDKSYAVRSWDFENGCWSGFFLHLADPGEALLTARENMDAASGVGAAGNDEEDDIPF